MPPKSKNTPKKPTRTLVTLEASRGRIREQIHETIGSIGDLESADPKFPDGQRPQTVLNYVKQLSAMVKSLDEEMLQHPEFDDENQTLHQEDCDKFEFVVCRAIAALDAACSGQPLAPTVTGTTFFTPDRPHVRFAGEAHTDPSATFGAESAAPERENSRPQTIVIRNSKDFDAAQKPEVFRGDRLRYRTFMKQFEIFISKNPQATDCERLIALRKFVADEPKALVDAFELTDANYRIALTTLEENYSRVDVDRERLLTELRTLRRVTHQSDIAKLRALVIDVQTKMRLLETLGIAPEYLAVLVHSSLNAALPPELRQLFRQWRRTDPNLAERAPTGSAANSDTASTPVRGMTSTPFAAAQGQNLFDITVDGSKAGPQSSEARLTDPVLEVQTTVRYILQHIRDYEDSGYLDKALTAPTENKSALPPRRTASTRRANATVSAVAAVPARRQGNSQNPTRPCLFCRTAEHNSSRCSALLTVEQRREILDKQKRCARCFRSQHARPEDCKGPRVACGVCQSRQHYSSMHVHTQSPQPTTPAAAPVVAGVVGGESEPDGPTVMLTARAYVLNGTGRIPVRLFLDHGSGLTFMSPSLRQLLLNVPPLSRRELNIDTFSDRETFLANRFRIVLQSIHDPKTKISLLAYERSYPVNPRNHLSVSARQRVREFGRTHPLADPDLITDDGADPPGIIVGLDQMFRVLLFEPPRTVDRGLVALNSHLGWTIGGPPDSTSSDDNRSRVTAVQAVCCVATLSHLTAPRPPAAVGDLSEAARLTERLWRLDAIGITDESDSSTYTAEETSALQQFQSSLVHDGERYVVAFPKRDSINSLQTNWAVALRRLESKLRQLQRDPDKYRRYHEEICKFVSGGHAVEIAVPSERNPEACDGSYVMPHHEVITSTDSGERWRIVFDCSAKQTRGNQAEKSTSLNEHLLPGPNLNEDLVTLLIGFRLHRIAVTADIKAAYLSIGLAACDRPLFRFLWKGPGDAHTRMFQMRKVTWGATSSGFILAATIRHHLKSAEPEIGEELAGHFYADDYVQSFPSDELAVQYTNRLRDAMASADMRLGKWKTNSAAVARSLTEAGVESVAYEPSECALFKVLGIAWSPSSDTLSFSIPNVRPRLSLPGGLTKRNALSIIASIYDPLGLLMPFTLRGKRILRELWSVSLQWEDPVPANVLADLTLWCEELDDLKEFTLSRHYAASDRVPSSYHLHLFGDASNAAFACAAYIEYRWADGTSMVSLVMSKSRLAPINSPPSLPRLELMAALIAVRLKNFIVERVNIEFSTIRFYTDSTITFHWVTSTIPGRWKPFVYNRVVEIQRQTRPDQWRHIAGVENPSDYATRGISARVLTRTASWWDGPEWLRWPPERQPISQTQEDSVDIALPQEELRHTSAPLVTTTLEFPLNLALFGSASCAVRVLAKVLRFAYLTRRLVPPLLPELHLDAERHIIRHIQSTHLHQELRATIAGEPPPVGSRVAGFSLFVDSHGVLRARTRLTVGPFFTYDEKNPVVLPGESLFARLLILDAHRVNAQFGVSTVLSQLRRRFWITRCRQIVKAILSKCVICKRRHARHANQIEAPLPEERVTMSAPFQTTGVDFCGPFFTRTREGTRKAYIALFTCAISRGVHLELTPLQTTPQTHLALRRFLAEHPACRLFISDNGRSFVKAATDLKRMFNAVRDREVRDLLESRSIEWSFNCPRAAWWGGFFERVIGVTKSALIKTLGRSLISFEELRTVIKELAAVINDRPISYVGTQADDPRPLTPSQFIHGGPYVPSLATLSPLDSLGPNGSVTAENLRESLSQRTLYFKHLSMRWHREYILELRTAQRSRGRQSDPLEPGSVCLLKEDNQPRIKWQLVRILEGHRGRDGQIRTYTIRTTNGKETRRAAQLLIPLEIADNTSAPSSQPDGNTNLNP